MIVGGDVTEEVDINGCYMCLERCDVLWNAGMRRVDDEAEDIGLDGHEFEELCLGYSTPGGKYMYGY